MIQDRHSDLATAMVGFDDDFPETVATVRIGARVHGAGPVEIGAVGAASWQLRVDDAVGMHELRTSGDGIGEELLAPPAVVSRYPTARAVEATATLWPADGSPLSGAGLFGLVARPARRDQASVVADAVAAARAADVAVVVVGLTAEQETEAVDKTTLRLPGEQDALVSAVAAAARRTVVVVNAATPVLMPWLAEVDAVLWAGLPGQEAGHAVAAALVGDIEPAGRLVSTFPAADGAAPAWSVTPVEGRLEYAEGTFIGYRGHAAGHAPAPAFWFGHGLGYASWAYGPASVSGADGVRAGHQHRHPHQPRGRAGLPGAGGSGPAGGQPDQPDQPVRLVGWAAVTAEPGETAPVRVDTDARLWRRWTPGRRLDRLPAGGRLLVARGLGDIRGRPARPADPAARARPGALSGGGGAAPAALAELVGRRSAPPVRRVRTGSARSAGSCASEPCSSLSAPLTAMPNTPWPPASRSTTSSADVHSYTVVPSDSSVTLARSSTPRARRCSTATRMLCSDTPVSSSRLTTLRTRMSLNE